MGKCLQNQLPSQTRSLPLDKTYPNLLIKSESLIFTTFELVLQQLLPTESVSQCGLGVSPSREATAVLGSPQVEQVASTDEPVGLQIVHRRRFGRSSAYFFEISRGI